MKLTFNKTGKSEYQLAPKGQYVGLIVDMWQPYEHDGKFGKQTKTRFVIELPVWKDEAKGWRFTARTKPMTLKLTENSNLYAFVTGILGRDLTSEEQDGFDPECLVGVWCDISIVHTKSDDGKVYDNIGYIGELTNTAAEKWQSTYVRIKDRPVKDGEPSEKEVAKAKAIETSQLVTAENKEKFKKMFADTAAGR